MTNRREFLQAAAISGLPLIAGASVNIEPAIPGAQLDLHAFLIDERHSQARSVATRLASAGTAVLAVPEGDITQVWLNDIGPAWRQHPAPVAGLTARPALFCLEQLAFTSGMRVVFHAEHIVLPNGHTEHSILRGAAEAQLSATQLRQAGPLWPALIANAIAIHRQQPRQAQPARPGRSDAALDPALPADAQLLTSWIIATV
jgi:hypothetical protein